MNLKSESEYLNTIFLKINTILYGPYHESYKQYNDNYIFEKDSLFF